MSDGKKIERIISRMGDLPAMPAVVGDVLRITNNPLSGMAELSKAIESDPGLAAKILRVSNSAYYGMKQYVGSLKLALVILGVREVRNIVLGISVFDILKQGAPDAEFIQDVWLSSLRIGGTAKALSKELGLRLEGEEFIAGLLSDMGKLVFLRIPGADYVSLHKTYANSYRSLCLAEQNQFGCTHADIAAALAERWSLPKSLVDALAYQYPSPETPLSEATEPMLAAVARLSKAACTEDVQQQDAAVFLDQEAWTILADSNRPIALEDRPSVIKDIVTSINEHAAINVD